MNDALLETIRINDAKLSFAIGQLGGYEALVNYLIDSIRGRTGATAEQVANYVENRQNELLDEQYAILFNRKK